MANIEERVESLIQSTIENLGYELYDVEYAKEAKNYFLRIYIDKENGIDLNDCEKVNDGIMELLDEADYIKDAYFLEVSSPGVEKNLRKEKHLSRNIGQKVEINLFKPFEKKKQLIGILEGFDEYTVKIKSEDAEGFVAIERKNIALIKTKYDW